MNSEDIIGGRYRLDRKIGEGGTGQIWLAHDSRLDRRVAIKFLFAHTARMQGRLAKRVAQEAKIAASIQHPNVVQIFDFGTHEENVPYIVMEALFGLTLGEAFDEAQSFSIDTMIHIVCEVLRGLAAVHDGGIVHRDLKPENIFLVKDSRGKLLPKLLDFGISRSLEPDTRPSAVTTTEGQIVGTPQYMSPEQAKGDKHIDERTDIYSVGTIMFEAFAGYAPFDLDSTTDILIALIQHEVPPLYGQVPEIGRALCAVVDKALTKDRNGRYAHAAEMLDAVVAAAHELPPELDRHAELFPPPDTISSRARNRNAGTADDLDESVASAAAPNDRTYLTSPRAHVPTSRAVWLAIGGVASLAVALAVAFAQFARNQEPEGSGLIVVQGPSSSPPASPQRAADALTPEAAAQPTPPVALDEAPDARRKKPTTSSGRARKPAATDPMQLLAAQVEEAFSKQKASVIACLNEHASDLEDAPQLHVRLQIDRSGAASAAELMPATISNKPVGRCLTTAVKQMSFPRPDQPTTLRVPLLWRRK